MTFSLEVDDVYNLQLSLELSNGEEQKIIIQ